MCRLVEAELRPRMEVVWRNSTNEAMALLTGHDFDVVVTDLNMKGMNGIELCAKIAEMRPGLPVVVITAFGSVQAAIASIRAGAYDFLTKPFEMEELALTLERALEHSALQREVKLLRRAVEDSHRFEDVLGASPAMRQVYDLLERVVDSDATVLVTGESGTGKEVVARALHAQGRRRAGPFVAINCAAMPETLLESELFGHAKGAFTDAKAAQAGLFVRANGGTLFLDEIGDMPLGLQPKLLRALQEKKVRPVGGSDEVAFDARIVAASNRDLESMVEEQRFREDLYYRINVIHVPLPPLRARGGDVLLLAQHLIDRFATHAGKRVTGLSAEAADKLLAYGWPGNVRELSNCIERAIALTRDEELTVSDLPEKIRSYRSSTLVLSADDPSEILPLEEVERRYILRVVESAGGNRSLAAQLLGVDRKTLYRKLERYAAG